MTNQSKSLNQDSNNLYWYEFRLRGFSPSCQPSNHIKVNHDLGRWGIIAYEEPLSEQQQFDYDLSPYDLK